MMLFGSHGVLTHPHRAKERDSYISSSLISSKDLNKRLSDSSRNERSRPLELKFHKYWRHPDCPVQQWYDLQTESSTKFTSIQHWRTKQTPVFHEYLLILLEDGSICRVERIGEGSRRAAITRVGCTAHDIIQWFGRWEYERDPISQEPAEMICQVDFPRAFDLIDVLAICWATQQTQSSTYTLQRFNCYFLCLTILAVLARRVGHWEGAIDNKGAWLAALEDTLGYLQRTACEDADDYAGIGTCDLVNADHSNPRDFVLDSLRTHLTVNGFEDWKASTSETLWMKDLEGNVKQGVSSHIRDSADTSLDSNSACATEMKKVLDFDVNDEASYKAHNIPHGFVDALVRGAAPLFIKVISEMATSAENTHRMRELEYGPPVLPHLAFWVVVPFLYAYVAIQGPKAFVDEEHKGGPTMLHRAMARWLRRNPSETFSTFRLAFLSGIDDNVPEDCDLDSLLDRSISLVLKRMLESPTCPTRTSKLHALMFWSNRNSWVKSLQASVGRAICNTAKSQITEVESNFKSHILRMSNSSSQSAELTVQEFHDYILDRIRTHGERVESVKLAAAELVKLDIDIAMSEVWKGLPSGYGGTAHTTEVME